MNGHDRKFPLLSHVQREFKVSLSMEPDAEGVKPWICPLCPDQSSSRPARNRAFSPFPLCFLSGQVLKIYGALQSPTSVSRGKGLQDSAYPSALLSRPTRPLNVC